MPGGKLEAGNTEWKTEVILPVVVEMTMVASVIRPDTTALEEASTVMGEVIAASVGDTDGGVPVACGAMMGVKLLADCCGRIRPL